MAESETIADAEPVADEEVPTHDPFVVKVLSMVQVQRSQNGLRHNDHLRYRQYCSRRLRRLYNVLKFKHGKGRFKNVPFPDNFQDSRFIEVLVTQCERAWSYGVQLKSDNANAPVQSPQLKHHSIRRLAKAAKISKKLESVCKVHADQRSQMEAEAYASLIEGTWLSEKEEWKEALEKLTRCKRVCEHLALASEQVESALFKLKIQDMTPMIRECRYNLGLGYDADDGDAGAVPLKQPTSGAGTGESELSYRGHGFPMPSDKIKSKLLKCVELVSGLKAAEGENHVEVLEKYSEIAAEFSDALDAIHSDMIAAGADGQTDDWRMLEAFAREISICMNIERNLALLRAQLEKFDGIQEAASPEARRTCKPDEAMRFCDLLKGDVAGLRELPLTTEGMTKSLAAYDSVILNCRSFFLALCNVQLGKTPEAAALMDLLHLRIDDVDIGKAHEGPLGRLHSVFEQVLLAMPLRIGTWRCRVLVQLCTESRETKCEADEAVGMDFASLGSFPPKFRDIPCKPLLFDLAYQCIEQPDLREFLPKGDAKGPSIIGRVAGGLGSRLGGFFGGKK